MVFMISYSIFLPLFFTEGKICERFSVGWMCLPAKTAASVHHICSPTLAGSGLGWPVPMGLRVRRDLEPHGDRKRSDMCYASCRNSQSLLENHFLNV